MIECSRRGHVKLTAVYKYLTSPFEGFKLSRDMYFMRNSSYHGYQVTMVTKFRRDPLASVRYFRFCYFFTKDLFILILNQPLFKICVFCNHRETGQHFVLRVVTVPF